MFILCWFVHIVLRTKQSRRLICLSLQAAYDGSVWERSPHSHRPWIHYFQLFQIGISGLDCIFLFLGRFDQMLKQCLWPKVQGLDCLYLIFWDVFFDQMLKQDWIAFLWFLGLFNQMLKQCLWPKVHVSPLPPWCVDSCHQVNPGITRSMYFLWPTIHILPLGVRRSRQRMDLCHLLRRK